MQELEDFSIKKLACPACRKEIPEGDFGLCPFYGASLKV